MTLGLVFVVEGAVHHLGGERTTGEEGGECSVQGGVAVV